VDLPDGDNVAFRIFEAMSCGSMVITRRMPSGQEELFTEGVHFVTFENEQDLLDKVQYYLTHDDERARIARDGHAEVLRHHTLDRRAAEMLELAVGDPRNGAPVRRMGGDEVKRLYAFVYERTGRIETLLKLAAREKQNKLAMAHLLGTALKSFCRRAIVGW
jgi:hypothetical protein